jgi:hypothetical protein
MGPGSNGPSIVDPTITFCIDIFECAFCIDIFECVLAATRDISFPSADKCAQSTPIVRKIIFGGFSLDLIVI